MNIKDCLNKILTAIYGRDVRAAIHDGIKMCYENSQNAKEELQTSLGVALPANITVTDGKFISTSNEKIEVVASTILNIECSYFELDVEAGEHYRISNCRMPEDTKIGVTMIYADAAGNIMDEADEDMEDRVITVMQGCSKIYVNFVTTGYSPTVVKIVETDHEELYDTQKLSWQSGQYYNKNHGRLSALKKAECAEINVTAGERFLISTTGYAYANPYMIVDSAGKKLLVYPDENLKETHYDNLEVTIPEGGARLLINNYTGKYAAPEIKKVLGLTAKGVGQNKDNIENIESVIDFEFLNRLDYVARQQEKNEIKWTTFDGVYLTLVVDDSNPDIDIIQNMAEEKNIPICYATIPQNLRNQCSAGETVKAVLKRAEEHGGEVMAHWNSPLTSQSTGQDYYDRYVTAKKILTEEGFSVYGIITAGGTNYQTQDFKKTTKYARPYYAYGDMTSYKTGKAPLYNNARTFIDNGTAAAKTLIDAAVAKGQGWINLGSHGTAIGNSSLTSNTIDDIGELIDYALDKGVHVATWKTLYEKFAK